MQRTMVFAYIQRPGFFLQGVVAVQGLGFRIAGTPQALNPQTVAKWAQAFRGSLWSGAISPPPPGKQCRKGLWFHFGIFIPAIAGFETQT